MAGLSRIEPVKHFLGALRERLSDVRGLRHKGQPCGLSACGMEMARSEFGSMAEPAARPPYPAASSALLERPPDAAVQSKNGPGGPSLSL
jgi:hypothetical protein